MATVARVRSAAVVADDPLKLARVALAGEVGFGTALAEGAGFVAFHLAAAAGAAAFGVACSDHGYMENLAHFDMTWYIRVDEYGEYLCHSKCGGGCLSAVGFLEKLFLRCCVKVPFL